MTDIDRNYIYDHLAKTNVPEYNYLKAAEELTELNEKLLKKLVKLDSEKEPSNQEIIEEIGDVEIRINILKRMFGVGSVALRVDTKLNTYNNFIQEGLYTGRI